MTTPVTDPVKAHDGMKVKRVREILKVKQSTLAHALGEEWSQKKVSYMEDKEEIDDKLMEEIANALKVPVDMIKNFDESTVLNIQNNYEGANTGNGNIQAFGTFNFNPLEKLMEVIDENKSLYERLLQSEREKVEMLNKILEDKK